MPGVSGESGLAGDAGLFTETGLSAPAGVAGLAGDVGLSGVAGLAGEAGLSGLAGVVGLFGESELPTEFISATGGAGRSSVRPVTAGDRGDRFTEAAEASDVDVGGITTGAESRGALLGASCNST
ncbi:MAG: hypothetical protein R8G01_19240 [Ilumatobacteraceae bacterium]|nr:hypothetical protein [Ilumatobacteraceae bacterium]